MCNNHSVKTVTWDATNVEARAVLQGLKAVRCTVPVDEAVTKMLKQARTYNVIFVF